MLSDIEEGAQESSSEDEYSSVLDSGPTLQLVVMQNLSPKMFVVDLASHFKKFNRGLLQIVAGQFEDRSGSDEDYQKFRI